MFDTVKIEWAILGGLFIATILFRQYARRPKTPLQEIQKMNDTQNAFFIDVRSPMEFAGGSIPGAKNIPLQSLPLHLKELPQDKSIVVFCASGARSAIALNLLKRAGFTEVHDLGAMSNWK